MDELKVVATGINEGTTRLLSLAETNEKRSTDLEGQG
jgi:hypothetical protein